MGFGPQLNVIVGHNAQGKTSILESLYLITQFKSFRSSKNQDLILYGQQEASISCELTKPYPTKILFGFDQKRKRVQIDGKAINHRSRYEFLGTSVSFSPDDLSLIKAGPDERRDFLDDLAINIDPSIATIFAQFAKTLTQRNRLLKQLQEGHSQSSLDLWDEAFIREAIRVYEIRESVVSKLSPVLPRIYNRLFGVAEELSLHYLNQFNDQIPSAEEFLKRLQSRRIAEIAVGYSLIGPHRDDLEIKINGLASRSFASQGQCRSLVIALKVAQLELTREAQKVAPLLLLDDIISELDEDRVRALLSYLSHYPGQMFLTTVEKTKIENLRENFANFQSYELSSNAPKSRINAELAADAGLLLS
jgi:DNA replication and repair protein RecF